MAALAKASGGMPIDELRREALTVFGGRRMTKGITERLDAAVALGVRHGRLDLTNGLVTACR